jgi:hypothetical protein
MRKKRELKQVIFSTKAKFAISVVEPAILERCVLLPQVQIKMSMLLNVLCVKEKAILKKNALTKMR